MVNLMGCYGDRSTHAQFGIANKTRQKWLIDQIYNKNNPYPTAADLIADVRA